MRQVTYRSLGQDENPHVWARGVITRAWPSVMSTSPSLAELQIVQALGRLESSYGRGWKNEGVGSNNWGAVQCCKPPCPEDAFLYTDTHPNADGTSTTYEICFKRYATPEDGAADIIRLMYVKRPTVWEAAKRGDIHGVAAALRATGYYEGFGATQEERIGHYAAALDKNVEAIAAANGESRAAFMDVSAGKGGGKTAVLPFLAMAVAGYVSFYILNKKYDFVGRLQRAV